MLYDTDVLVDYLRGRHSAEDCLRQSNIREASTATWMELVEGVRSKRELIELRKAFKELGITIVPITERIDARATSLLEEHWLNGNLDSFDALIAATALEHGSMLTTGNMKHFRQVKGLSLEAYVRRPAML